MKRLNGKMIIEFMDSDSNVIETITEENIITNAVNDIMGINPLAVFYSAGTGQVQVDWHNQFLPICPNLIGGILLFSKALEANPDNIYPGSNNLPVAYASNDVNSTSNTARGSLNLTESKALENGYRFVWEFSPSQGNGTIAAVALTSSFGGANGFGSEVDVKSPFLHLKRISIKSLPDEIGRALYDTVEIDFENQKLYALSQGSSANAIVIKKYHYPIFEIGLSETLDDASVTLISENVINTSTFQFLGSRVFYGECFDGHDGYWYAFSNKSNTIGNSTMNWIRIKKDDLTFTEGTWTLSNVKIEACGKRRLDGSYAERSIQSWFRDGYLYCMGSNHTEVYKINFANPTDVKVIPLGFESEWRPLGAAGASEMRFTQIQGIIYAYDFMILADDTIVKTVGDAHFPEAASPHFQYKEFLIGWGGNYSSRDRDINLLTPYLASINNLSSPVVKNADKTMKITYTLTEEEVLP